MKASWASSSATHRLPDSARASATTEPYSFRKRSSNVHPSTGEIGSARSRTSLLLAPGITSWWDIFASHSNTRESAGRFSRGAPAVSGRAGAGRSTGPKDSGARRRPPVREPVLPTGVGDPDEVGAVGRRREDVDLLVGVDPRREDDPRAVRRPARVEGEQEAERRRVELDRRDVGAVRPHREEGALGVVQEPLAVG